MSTFRTSGSLIQLVDFLLPLFSGGNVGDVLIKADSTSMEWSTLAGLSTLDSLSDVDASSPTNGQVLTYNSGTGNWEAAGSAAGEANTASNVGVGDGNVFKQKTGVDLEFKTLISDTGLVVITDNASEIDLDVNIDLDAINNVTLTTVADKQRIAYDNGTSQWVNVDNDADLVVVAASPSNYTAGSADVEAHLAGIDTALGSVSVTIPYDVAITLTGGPLGTTVPTRVFVMEAVTAFDIPATGHKGHAVTGPTGSSAVFTLYVNTVSKGTFTFTTGGGDGQDITATLTATSVVAGDLVELRLTTADSNDIMQDVSVVIKGTVA